MKQQRLPAFLSVVVFAVASVNNTWGETLSLVQDATCYGVNDTVLVNVNLTDLPGVAGDPDDNIVAGQFLLADDNTVLSLDSADPFSIVPGNSVDAGSVFDAELFELAGRVSYAVSDGIGGVEPGTDVDSLMAQITFTALAEVCLSDAELVWTTDASSPPTRLSRFDFGSITPATNDLQDLSIDDTDPTIDVVASNQTVECDGAGNIAALNAWLASNGGAAASDDCGTISWSNDFTALSDLCGATGSATVTFTAADDCGNNATTQATFTIEDTTDPSIDTPASDLTVECDGAGNITELGDWLATNGGAEASDACGGVSWVDDSTGISDDCGATGFEDVMFTATDECGNSTDTMATFTIEDTTPPSITCPANINVEADAGTCNTFVSYTEPTPSDVCDASPSMSCDFPNPSVFGSGTTTVTCMTMDTCGNSDDCSFDVTVDPVNRVQAIIQLADVFSGIVDRCISFELWLATCPGTPVFVDEVVTLSNGGGLADFTVPCGNYMCMTVRDSLHTLRRTEDDLASTISSDTYQPDFTAGNGAALVSMNLNDDMFIDVLDFGVFNAQWLQQLTADTDCSTAFPHSNFNADATVDNLEFTILTANFFDESDANCCGMPNNTASTEDGPITSISVKELRRSGRGELAAGDLNADGWLDLADIEAFAAGARPAPAGNGRRRDDYDARRSGLRK
ncbi:MAG: HYR domain-containing protein [Planctomycetota bacterium]|jgi:hypothetical protein